MEWLMSTVDDYVFEVRGAHVLVATHKVQPADLIDLMVVAEDFVRHLPHVVFSLYPKSG
jgi:hypothetical protein